MHRGTAGGCIGGKCFFAELRPAGADAAEAELGESLVEQVVGCGSSDSGFIGMDAGRWAAALLPSQRYERHLPLPPSRRQAVPRHAGDDAVDLPHLEPRRHALLEATFVGVEAPWLVLPQPAAHAPQHSAAECLRRFHE